MNELEQTMAMLECGNLQGQERHQLTEKLVDLVRKDELKKLMSDALPHCAACMQAWSVGARYTIDYSTIKEKP